MQFITPFARLASRKRFTRTFVNKFDQGLLFPEIPSPTDVPLTQAKTWTPDITHKEWWIYDKLRGIRVFWDGKAKLLQENGKEIPAPISFTMGLPRSSPSISLDAILWYGDEEKCIKMIQTSNNTMWNNARLIIYDTPSMHQMKIGDRITFLRNKKFSSIHRNYLFMEPKRVPNVDKEVLQQILAQSRQKGAANLLMKKSQSFYYDEDSFYTYQSLTETYGVVVDIILNTGHVICQLLSRAGTYQVAYPNKSPPVVGTVLVLGYEPGPNSEVTKLTWLHARTDLRWKDVERTLYPYVAAFGKRTGPLPSCRGCGVQFKNRHELRAQVKATFKTPNSGPYVGPIYFCLNPSCITTAATRDKEKGIDAHYPDFDGSVAVPKEVNNSVKVLPKIDGINWVIC